MRSNNGKPLVSVLIPTHERPYYFSLALASVIKQTYENIEIVISDNSEDNETEKIVQDFQSKYENIKYYHTPGLDMEANWQKCWDNMDVDSEYVNFLMDDDVFASTKIENMVAYFVKDPSLSLVTSYRILIDEKGNPLPDCEFNTKLFDTTSLIKGRDAAKHVLKSCCNWIGEPTTVLFNRKYANGRFRGWTGKEKYLILDYPLWLRLLECGNMVYITEPLSFFRQHETNDSKDLTTHLRACLSFATVIQNAWNNRLFLETPDETRESLGSWQMLAIRAINHCYEIDYRCREFDDLISAFDEISEKFSSKQMGRIIFDFDE